MIVVIEKGSERKFVHECDKCKSVFTYRAYDARHDGRLICPVCETVIYVNYVPYKESE